MQVMQRSFVDQIRQRAGLNPLAAAPTLDDIYRERGFELNMEGHRRQDMIRFDKFLEPNWFKGESPAHRSTIPDTNGRPGRKSESRTKRRLLNDTLL